MIYALQKRNHMFRKYWKPILKILIWSCCWQACQPVPQKSLSRGMQPVRPLEFEYLKLSAAICYDDTVHPCSFFYVNFRIQKDQCIWVTVSLPWGIEIMRGMLTPTSAALINHLQQTYLVYDYETLQLFWPGPWDYNLVQALLLGEPIRLAYKANKLATPSDQQVAIQYGVWVLSQMINPALGKVDKLVATASQETLIASYKNFKSYNEGLFFGQASFSWYDRTPLTKPTITLTLTGVKVHWPKKALKFPFIIPKHYEKME